MFVLSNHLQALGLASRAVYPNTSQLDRENALSDRSAPKGPPTVQIPIGRVLNRKARALRRKQAPERISTLTQVVNELLTLNLAEDAVLDDLLQFGEQAHGILGNAAGDLFAFNPQDGSPAWSYHFKGIITSTGASGDVLYVGTQEGMLFAVRRTK